MKITLAVITTLLMLSLLVLSSCKTIYVCYDGTRQEDSRDCPTVPYPVVTERDAEHAVDNYGVAYALAKTDKFTRVNVYAKDGDWYSDVKFTNIKNAEVHSVTLKVDGKTSSITCLLGCDYLKNKKQEEPKLS